QGQSRLANSVTIKKWYILLFCLFVASVLSCILMGFECIQMHMIWQEHMHRYQQSNLGFLKN
ncbi:hypothetical protein ACJX0J_016780, partial [Zea mays]